MPAHPYSTSVYTRYLLAVTGAAGLGGLWLLAALYDGYADIWVALADSVSYAAFFILMGYVYWFIVDFIRSYAARIAVALFVQIVCIGVALAVMTLAGLSTPTKFARLIPLHAIYGLLWWTILTLWYGNVKAEQTGESEPELPKDHGNVIDRITVKNGAEIEIITLARLVYIQAYGDYVMLHTETRRLIKEQTMKHFETSLPESFVRVHRSFIVNTDYIARVELAGKENYTIKLKNGVGIRASAAGYKLLRQRLSL